MDEQILKQEIGILEVAALKAATDFREGAPFLNGAEKGAAEDLNQPTVHMDDARVMLEQETVTIPHEEHKQTFGIYVDGTPGKMMFTCHWARVLSATFGSTYGPSERFVCKWETNSSGKSLVFYVARKPRFHSEPKPGAWKPMCYYSLVWLNRTYLTVKERGVPGVDWMHTIYNAYGKTA
ncbi:hypothetical protein QFC20_002680 [Naganishia adeliensis]|uniref:Uncharacterized protein n=1 Tax=Naganishia adeliensis TaxID=92952 RepID=A0ACC2WIE8_9TREE|nr:hypothetical protein QFC20_002680 [Naganishia adeliensis]